MRKWWRSLFTEKALLRAENRRLRESNFAVEEELQQLRCEIRGAVNTALAQAGCTPLPGAELVKTPAVPRMRKLTLQQRQRMYALETMPKQAKTVQ